MSTGLEGQFGLVPEVTYGTLVTVTEFFPILSENINLDIARIEDDTIIAGRRLQQSTQWGAGAQTVSGPVQTLLWTTATKTLLKNMFGTESGAGPFTYIPGSLLGDSMTIQVGRPGTGGVVHPFTFSGCKVGSWEIAASEGQAVTLGLDIMGQDQTTGTALASASYGDLNPFRFTHATFTIAATAYTVSQFRLSGDNALEERRFDGTDITIEPLESGERVFDGSFTAEFIDLTQMNRYVNGTEAALVASFNDGGGNTLVITMNTRFDGATPSLSGKGVLEIDVPFKCVSTTSDAAACTAVLTLA